MPRGYYSRQRGSTVIHITYDPNDKSVNSRHKRIVKVDSKAGRQLVPIIEESMKLQRELDYLLAEWNARYWIEPKSIEYPLRKVRQSILNSEFFHNASINANDYKREELKIEYKGQWFRTKNEVAGAMAIESMGYAFKSEVCVHRNGSEYDHYPDVSANIPELDLMLMTEIDGLVGEKGNYRFKSLERQYNYLSDGFREFKDIVFLRMDSGATFDPESYKTLIRTAIEANINDLFTD